jgi:hypothetical protein
VSIVNGIRCDWCGETANLQGNQSFPSEIGWCRLTTAAKNDNFHRDLCPSCTNAAGLALAKAEKRCRTGKTQR